MGAAIGVGVFGLCTVAAGLGFVFRRPIARHVERCFMHAAALALMPAIYGAAKGVAESSVSSNAPLVSPNTPPAAVGLEAASSIAISAASATAGALGGLSNGCLWWCLLSIPAAFVAFPVLLFVLPVIDVVNALRPKK